MKTFISLPLLLMSVSCSANAQPTSSVQKFELTGDSLPAIRHITDMKISGDTLYFVYETQDGFGQRYLRSAIIDKENAKLNIRPEIGKREDGYYVSYMPYPFFDASGNVHIVSQDDGEIYDLLSGNALTRTKKYLVSGNSTVPFPMSQYVQDVSMIAPDNYVFIGREPNGGSQYAMKANASTAIVDTIRKIAISPGLQSWMPNAGELTYSRKHDRLMFAYRLHPVIEIFDMDGNLIRKVEIAEETFDAATLSESDFEDLNPLHTVDMSTLAINTDSKCGSDEVFLLVWGHSYTESLLPDFMPTICVLDWEGNIRRSYIIHEKITRFCCFDAETLIGWNGNKFVLIRLNEEE